MHTFSNIYKSGITLVVSLLLFVNSCISQASLKESYWRAQLSLNDSTKLRFDFYVTNRNSKRIIEIIDGKEKIIVDEISFAGDSLFFKMPVFDSEFRCKKTDDKKMTGVWINHARKTNTTIPFEAFSLYPDGVYTKGEDSIFYTKSAYEVTFSKNLPDSSKAVGIFNETNFYYVNGTFLTETGDYRYLSGTRSGNKFELSCFDGSHAFVFKGKVKGIYNNSKWVTAE